MEKGLELFIQVEPDQPDQFMAIKPWKGAIKAPSNPPPVIESQPDLTYEIEFVHGYLSKISVQNLHYNPKKQPVYMTAALGVILDPQSRTQKIFGGGEKLYAPVTKKRSPSRSSLSRRSNSGISRAKVNE